MSYTGERFLPTESNHEMNIEHYQRYRFALQLVKGKTILDAACGEGYGSYLLSQEATHVFGMDIDAVVVSEASKKYTASNLQYLVGNVSSLPFENGSFDCVVSFETLEHIDSDSQIKFLSEIKRILKPDGILIMSSPNKAVYTDLVQGKNKFHIKELYCNEFIELLKNYFQYFINYSQYPDTGYFICSPNETLTIEYNGKAIEKSSRSVEQARSAFFELAVYVEQKISGLQKLFDRTFITNTPTWNMARKINTPNPDEPIIQSHILYTKSKEYGFVEDIIRLSKKSQVDYFKLKYDAVTFHFNHCRYAGDNTFDFPFCIYIQYLSDGCEVSCDITSDSVKLSYNPDVLAEEGKEYMDTACNELLKLLEEKMNDKSPEN